MQTARNIFHNYWATPVLGVVIGAIYLIAFSVGGQPLIGVVCLAIMLVFSIVIALAGRHSETVKGLLDHRDERIAGMDLVATATAAVAMIVAVLVGFTVSVAEGHSGWPYDIVGAIGGLGYIAAVAWQRVRA